MSQPDARDPDSTTPPKPASSSAAPEPAPVVASASTSSTGSGPGRPDAELAAAAPVEEHLDQDRLIELALGDSTPSPSESAHLADCRSCAAELASLSSVALIGREVHDVADLPAPSSRVWDAIATQTVELTAEPPVPAQPEASSLSAPPLPVPVSSPQHDRWRGLAVAAAVVIVGVAFGAGVMSGLRSLSGASSTASPPPGSGLASASLRPQVAASGASGSAQLLLLSGQQVLRVRVTGLPRTTGFYEVWLYDPSADRMVPLGTMAAEDSVDLPVPSTVDPRVFHVVDVSAQPLNGDPAHGRSMLRGSLH